jgi:WD40 repeat protein
LQEVQPSGSSLQENGSVALLAVGRKGLILRRDDQGRYRQTHALEGHSGPIRTAAFDASHDRVATAAADGTITVHLLKEPKQPSSLVQLDEVGASANFSEDGTALMGMNGSSTPLVAGMGSRRENSSRPRPPALSVDIRETSAFIRNTQSGRSYGSITPPDGAAILQTAVSRDGRTWAAASSAKVEVGPVGHQPSRRYRTLPLPPGFQEISAVALSDDGRTIAVAGVDATRGIFERFAFSPRRIHLFDTESGRLILSPDSDGETRDPVRLLEFGPDGDRLLALTLGQAEVWDVGPRLWLDRACAKIDAKVSAKIWKQVVPDWPPPRNCADGP